MSFIGYIFIIFLILSAIFAVITSGDPSALVGGGIVILIFLALVYSFNYLKPVPPPPPKPLSNIDKQLQDVQSQQKFYQKRIDTDIPELKSQMNGMAIAIKTQIHATDISETNKALFNDQIKATAKTLLALDIYEKECKDTIIRLQVAGIILNRTKSLGDCLGDDQAKIIEKLSKKAADSEVKLSVNIDKYVGSGVIPDAKIQEMANELLK